MSLSIKWLLHTTTYSLTRIEERLPNPTDAAVFSNAGLTNVYSRLLLDDVYGQYPTVNTDPRAVCWIPSAFFQPVIVRHF